MRASFLTCCFILFFSAGYLFAQTRTGEGSPLMGNRFLTLNTVIRVNQIEVARDRNVGEDERSVHTPQRVIDFRKAIAKGFPGARITWALSWLALHDTSDNYIQIRKLVADYHYKYGDEVTFIPGAYFANAYNSTEQVNKDLHEGLTRVSEIVGRGYRPVSIVAGFLSSKNMEYLAKEEGIHVCQANIWSQYSIDNQDGDGSVSYPFYPSTEHFCKPAQGKDDFIDCVNLDGWTCDFLAARRAGFAEGFNSRMGVGPIETLGKYGLKTGLDEMVYTTAIHFDKGFQLNGFGWVTNCWELSLPYDVNDITLWLEAIKKRWPGVRCVTQGEFGLIWRKHYKQNSFNYRFEENGSGIGGSDKDKKIRWFMNKDFRLAVLSSVDGSNGKVIDLTRYDKPAKEPESGSTRNWSLMGEINQKGIRPQDKPVPLSALPPEDQAIIRKYKINFGRLAAQAPAGIAQPSPKIVNIVNFIRLLEPRDPAITEDVLYQTVVKQVEIMKKYRLGGTFLLQYDALMDGRYQSLLKGLSKDSFEIGGWWEIPQPLVERAGMKWSGRYPWDWRANIGFSTGYTQQEREKLIDVYMADFKRVFGYYPRTVGSWFIDAYSLNYMYTKYHIVASCNCKDQYGTDGYTLWGGYWNQAYYPSRINSYMPAQHAEQQIPVPIFRMLGSDPVRQYDNGLGSSRQGVVTLEPVYKFGGGSQLWVDWFFDALVEDPSLGFNYTQAGQENSFTWAGMSKGFGIQMPMIARLRDERKIRVETMEASGKWFRQQYKVTPVTSFSVSKDIEGSDRKTIWYDSRWYRMNILWEHGTLRIRDIHLFNEKMPSVYETTPVTENECRFFTLPFVDGYIWSKKDQLAGMRLYGMIDGKKLLLEGGQPVFTRMDAGTMRITWPLTTVNGDLEIVLSERKMTMRLKGGSVVSWWLDLTTAEGAQLPFGTIGDRQVGCQFEGMKYSVRLEKGKFSQPGDGAVLRVSPEAGTIDMAF